MSSISSCQFSFNLNHISSCDNDIPSTSKKQPWELWLIVEWLSDTIMSVKRYSISWDSLALNRQERTPSSQQLTALNGAHWQPSYHLGARCWPELVPAVAEVELVLSSERIFQHATTSACWLLLTQNWRTDMRVDWIISGKKTLKGLLLSCVWCWTHKSCCLFFLFAQMSMAQGSPMAALYRETGLIIMEASYDLIAQKKTIDIFCISRRLNMSAPEIRFRV